MLLIQSVTPLRLRIGMMTWRPTLPQCLLGNQPFRTTLIPWVSTTSVAFAPPHTIVFANNRRLKRCRNSRSFRLLARIVHTPTLFTIKRVQQHLVSWKHQLVPLARACATTVSRIQSRPANAGNWPSEPTLDSKRRLLPLLQHWTPVLVLMGVCLAMIFLRKPRPKMCSLDPKIMPGSKSSHTLTAAEETTQTRQPWKSMPTMQHSLLQTCLVARGRAIGLSTPCRRLTRHCG